MKGDGAREKTMVRDLTEGSIPKLLLRFALPLLAANALQALYNLVDMVVVGKHIGGAGMSAVSIGGDSDTIAAIAGSIAEAYFGVPADIRKQAESYLDETLLSILRRFEEKYPGKTVQEV